MRSIGQENAATDGVECQASGGIVAGNWNFANEVVAGRTPVAELRSCGRCFLGLCKSLQGAGAESKRRGNQDESAGSNGGPQFRQKRPMRHKGILSISSQRAWAHNSLMRSAESAFRPLASIFVWFSQQKSPADMVCTGTRKKRRWCAARGIFCRGRSRPSRSRRGLYVYCSGWKDDFSAGSPIPLRQPAV